RPDRLHVSGEVAIGDEVSQPYRINNSKRNNHRVEQSALEQKKQNACHHHPNAGIRVQEAQQTEKEGAKQTADDIDAVSLQRRQLTKQPAHALSRTNKYS